MSVTAFRLENFMAFEDTGWLELRPISLLFGRNSTGKSAIIRALRFLKQNLNTEPYDPIRFVTEYGVDLGSFQDAVHRKDNSQEMRFHFRCDLPADFDLILAAVNRWREESGFLQFKIDHIENRQLEWCIGLGWHPTRNAVISLVEITVPMDLDEEDGTMLFSAELLDPKIATQLGYDWLLGSDFEPLNSADWQHATINNQNNFLPTLTSFVRTRYAAWRVGWGVDTWKEVCDKSAGCDGNLWL